jgi:LysM repeat protein
MKKIAFAIVCFFVVESLHAQLLTGEQYIDKYKNIAIAEMIRSGVPASITLAQGLLETENGNSELVKISNNHFGIKCKKDWKGESVTHTDDAPNECFRKYSTAEESFRDHSDYLKNTPRYASLFRLDISDYKGWAYGLKRAGYATNPRYPQILINNIERYNLQQYNNETLADVSVVQKDTETTIKPGIVKEDVVVKNEVVVAPVKKMEEPKKTSIFPARVKKSKTLFNSLNAVFAQRQTSLLAIATDNDIPLAKLLEYNDLKTDGLLNENQWIYLEKKPKQGNRDYYVAIQNESLYHISQTNAVQLQSLMEYNNMQENQMVKIGTRIRLRPATTGSKPTSSNNKIIHEVQPKEGLYGIAKKYNVSVQDIKVWNNLDGEDLKIGQQLIISK